jgi:hypothetical protein
VTGNCTASLDASTMPVVERCCAPGRQNYLVHRVCGFNPGRLLFDNLRVRLNAAITIGLAGQ